MLARQKIDDRTEQRNRSDRDRFDQERGQPDRVNEARQIDQRERPDRSDRRVQKRDQSNLSEQRFKDLWAQKAKGFLKAELKRQSITYSELARRLTEMGWSETEGSVTVKINRGTFPLWFFMAALHAIGVDLHAYEPRR
jgi:hypothetical protein